MWYNERADKKVHSIKCLHKLEESHTTKLTAYLKALDQKELSIPNKTEQQGINSCL